MATLGDLLKRARQTTEHLLAKHLAKADYRLILDLIRVRQESGLTQQEVADRLGMTQQAVSKIERYDSDPKLSTLRRYALAVGAIVTHVVEMDEGQLEQGERAAMAYTVPSSGRLVSTKTYAAPGIDSSDVAMLKRTDVALAG